MTLLDTTPARTAPIQTVCWRTAPPTAREHAASIFGKSQKYWLQHREASLNWLALGLLLAAWNAADGEEPGARPRPDSLRGYAAVSVRAVQHVPRDVSPVSDLL